mgnify:CR=1 FL=1
MYSYKVKILLHIKNFPIIIIVCTQEKLSNFINDSIKNFPITIIVRTQEKLSNFINDSTILLYYDQCGVTYVTAKRNIPERMPTNEKRI